MVPDALFQMKIFVPSVLWVLVLICILVAPAPGFAEGSDSDSDPDDKFDDHDSHLQSILDSLQVARDAKINPLSFGVGTIAMSEKGFSYLPNFTMKGSTTIKNSVSSACDGGGGIACPTPTVTLHYTCVIYPHFINCYRISFY